MSVKNRLNEIKQLKSLNIKEFSELAHLSYRTAQNYLSGDREPHIEGLHNLHTHLGINLNWLVSGVGKPLADETDLAVRPVHFSSDLNAEEQELLALFRQSSELGRAVIMSAARGAEKKEAAFAAGQVA